MRVAQRTVQKSMSSQAGACVRNVPPKGAADGIPSLPDAIRELTQWLSSIDHHYHSVNTVPSPRAVVWLCRLSGVFGVFWRQLFRLCPIDLRPRRQDRAAIDPKANILFATAYLRLITLMGESFREPFTSCMDRVRSLRSSQTRRFAIRQNRDLYLKYWRAEKDSVSPLLTAWAGDLFLMSYRCFQSPEYLDLAGQVADYFVQEYPKEESEDGVYFLYHPGLHKRIYNASAQISGFLLDYGFATGNAQAADCGWRGLHFVVGAQNRDGSWFYGREKGVRYIDNFHTAFILLALHRALSVPAGCAFHPAFARGLEFYVARLFRNEDGEELRPVHYERRYWPTNSSAIQKVDIRDAALAIILFSLLAREDAAWLQKAGAIWKWTHRHMKVGPCYSAEITWLWRNNIPYIEFQAWMLLGLATYLESVCSVSASDAL